MPVLANLLRRMTTRSAETALAPAAPQRLALDSQWSKLCAFLSASHDRVNETRRFHSAAEDQLDAAAYALGELVDDLAAVMAMPPRQTGPAIYRLPQPATASRVVIARRRTAAAA